MLYDPLLLFSYLIYYIYCIVGYDAGGYIIVGDGVARWIYYYIVAGGVTSCSSVVVAGVICYVVGGVDSSANSGPVGVVGYVVWWNY